MAYNRHHFDVNKEQPSLWEVQKVDVNVGNVDGERKAIAAAIVIHRVPDEQGASRFDCSALQGHKRALSTRAVQSFDTDHCVRHTYR